MNIEEKLNMTMLCDFYELTMGNGYFENGFKDKITYFDVFFRRVPDQGGFAIAAGLEQLIDYIENLHFTQEDIAYLRGRNLFCEEFLEYLANFRFTGDIYAVPEGTPVFPKEPLVVVRAPAIEAQLIETFTLLTINHQSLIATKASATAAMTRTPRRGPLSGRPTAAIMTSIWHCTPTPSETAPPRPPPGASSPFTIPAAPAGSGERS